MGVSKAERQRSRETERQRQRDRETERQTLVRVASKSGLCTVSRIIRGMSIAVIKPLWFAAM